MDEYIGKGALYDALWDAKEEKKVKSLKDVFDFIDKFPVEDVAEVKRGEWIKRERRGGFPSYACSVCGYSTPWSDGNYCKACGADMRKEGADNG